MTLDHIVKRSTAALGIALGSCSPELPEEYQLHDRLLEFNEFSTFTQPHTERLGLLYLIRDSHTSQVRIKMNDYRADEQGRLILDINAYITSIATTDNHPDSFITAFATNKSVYDQSDPLIHIVDISPQGFIVNPIITLAQGNAIEPYITRIAPDSITVTDTQTDLRVNPASVQIHLPTFYQAILDKESWEPVSTVADLIGIPGVSAYDNRFPVSYDMYRVRPRYSNPKGMFQKGDYQ